MLHFHAHTKTSTQCRFTVRQAIYCLFWLSTLTSLVIISGLIFFPPQTSLPSSQSPQTDDPGRHSNRPYDQSDTPSINNRFHGQANNRRDDNDEWVARRAVPSKPSTSATPPAELELPYDIIVDRDSAQKDDGFLSSYNELLHLFAKGIEDVKRQADDSDLNYLVRLDARLRIRAEDRPDYRLYPQMINTRQVVDAIKAGRPVAHAPINNPRLTVLRYPRDACQSLSLMESDGADDYDYRGRASKPTFRDPDLVVMVKSCTHCFTQRMRARNTYMQSHLWHPLSVRFVFVTGSPVEQLREHFSFDNGTINVTLIKTPDFRLPKDRLALMQLEADVYGDMLIGHFDDTYYNLTTKMMLTYRWLTVYCKAPVTLFIDNDYSILPINLVKLLQSTPDHLIEWLNVGTKGANGRVQRRKPRQRKNMYAIDENQFPWARYPAYSSGAAYLLGSRLVEDCAIGMAFVQSIRFDDAFLGIVLDKLGYNVLHIDGMHHGENVTGSCRNASFTITAPSDYLDPCVSWNTGTLKRRVVVNQWISNFSAQHSLYSHTQRSHTQTTTT